MSDPVIVRESVVFSEIFTGGNVTAIRTTINMRHEETPIVIETVWEIPEAEQLNAEQWHATKRNIGPTLVVRAAEDTNIEFKVMQAVQSYLDNLNA